MHQLIHYNMGSKSAIGIGNGICFKQVRDKGGGSYIDPLVRDSIVGLWKFDQNTNESPTRNIIKNTIKGNGGDLELLNFGYRLNSGYNGYATDFTEWYGGNANKTQIKITVSEDIDYPINIVSFKNATSAPSFRIKVSRLPKGQKLYYKYINEEGLLEERFDIPSDGIYTLPATAISDTPTTVAMLANEQYGINIKGLTIEQLPLYEGALVTDGKDDMIVSQKTVQEMGITDKITVVSMIHQIGVDSRNNRGFTNYIINQNVDFIRNNVSGIGIGKTGIYGYTWNNSTKSVINNILGDKNDYSVEVGNSVSIEGKFTVEGYINDDSPEEVSEVAVYWTFIANKVLTTDEINQIIAYFKLDKYVTPQVIYDVKRQGLTNDTPAADWYLKDFSGNGHDMQLYNYAKSKDSGIGKYAEDFTNTDWIVYPNVVVSKDKITVNSLYDEAWFVYKRQNNRIPPMKIKIVGIPANGIFSYGYCKNSSDTDPTYLNISEDGIYDLPESVNGNTFTVGFMVKRDFDWTHIEITQIPDYEGALVSDGKDDYGKAEGLPIFKDYTVAADYARLSYDNIDSAIISKSYAVDNGAFGFNLASGQSPNNVSAISFGADAAMIQADDNYRKIRYQSKYVNDGVTISAGNGIDGNEMWLSCLRENYNFSESALYSMLLFSYSLSEFLLERQLKKYKLGTLYPDMIEWRPIAKSNIPYKQIDYFIKRSGVYVRLNPGDYFQSTEDIIVRVTPIRDWQLDVVSSIKVNGKNEVISVNSSYAQTAPIHIDKSPQKIDITIDEYIRYEDIVQPYPAIINLKQDGKTITWGDKLKVGSEATFVNHTNLLPDLYTVSGRVQYNGTYISGNTSIRVEKSMVFVNLHSYKKANEPNCILAPQTLRIPNSSYKILGYIPDLTGKGNHGRLNNFAYTEESGANEDGSIRFDGVDDYIIIPTIKHGGKALLMKVNWRYKNYIAMAYDQRINWLGFGISISKDQLPSVAYKPYNTVTYIDGIENKSVLVQDLEGITHNITGIYDNLNLSDERDVCISRTSDASNSGFADMSMYEFMLFPDVPNEEEIKELNDIVGIEGGY